MADIAVINGRLAFPLPSGKAPQIENGTLYFWAVAAVGHVPHFLLIKKGRAA